MLNAYILNKGALLPLSGNAKINRKTTLIVADEGVQALLKTGLRKHRDTQSANKLTLLIEPLPAPKDDCRYDGRVLSFIVSGELLEVIPSNTPIEQLAYLLTKAALSNNNIAIDVIHKPDSLSSEAPASTTTVDVIIPHRGDEQQLLQSVQSILDQTYPTNIKLCLDQANIPNGIKQWQSSKQLSLYKVQPEPAGPYVIRQHFGMNTKSDFIAFHDADDYSLPTRLQQQLALAAARNVDIVGCHELRLDDIDHCLRAYRFPLAVNQAIDKGAKYPQLFPTTVVRSTFFKQSGGLSSCRRFGSDSQFLYRAALQTKIVNCDEFLYIRRKQPNSLTTSEQTGTYSKLRINLFKRWYNAYHAIKAQNQRFETSALAVETTQQRYRITQL